ncbi:hypothetical protein [Methylobacterium brachythecii]|uniref:Uncharacterized protein n=1 Tax=Methylobacterium brachythecii TaxID=1176177 RepID=A0A7W6AK96_9HYPH|nr:hypothetical protein [Methylobacterium brachythecii]MBB3902805.1 hypothetical protein [Methylobacterium brachythecii]GLS43730.1 hypothetical protein GCM10007884_17150 [Methylobacterium brachythecii]
MAWFGKKTPGPAKVLTRWTPELWDDASGSGSRFDATVVIRAVKESGEWIHANRQMHHDVEYRGTLDRLPEHPLSEVPVDLRFDTQPHPYGSQHGDTQTLGLAYTGAYGDEKTGFPCLSVRIWGDESGAAAFEAAFMRALAAGLGGLRVWFSADWKAPTITASASGFAAIQPVSRIKYDQIIRLDGSR